MPAPRDYSYQQFGKLTAISFTGRYHITKGGNKLRLWTFQCTCGDIIESPVNVIASGLKKTCGKESCNGRRSGADSLAWDTYKRTYADGDLSFDDFKRLSQLPCHYCGAAPANKSRRKGMPHDVFIYNGLDRMDQDQPHHLANCVPCCWYHNNKKRRESTQQFLQDAEKVVLHQVWLEIEEKYQ